MAKTPPKPTGNRIIDLITIVNNSSWISKVKAVLLLKK